MPRHAKTPSTAHLLAASLLLQGCGFLDAEGEPIREAHRGGSGYWPQNSRTAMLGALEAGYDAVEFDLLLTSDGIPVLSHDPWVHETLCTTAEGDSVNGRILVMDLTLEAYQSEFLCGGVPDPDFPDAEVVADAPMSFDELLVALGDHPDVLVHIDVKYEPDYTPGPEAFAEAILPRWWDADLPNPFYVSANLPEAIRAFEAIGADAARDVPTSLAWPRFPPDASTVPIAVGNELTTTLGVEDLVRLARRSEADGLCIPYQVADRRRVEILRGAGLDVQLWTLNSETLLERFARWPVDSLITDYPGVAP